MKIAINFSLFTILVLLAACNSKPTVVEPVKAEQSNNPEAATPDNSVSHKVVVEDFIQTSKYTYLQVSEDKKPVYWIAISKADVAKGETYIYTGGLVMRGFKSTELNRIFDEVLLVSKIGKPGSSNESLVSETFSKMQSPAKEVKLEHIPPVKGAVQIAELLANPNKYEGKIITVTGRCSKINHMIMNRNWIHLEDGTKDHKEITITSQDLLELGSVGIFEGKISLNKDFGAGYKYEIIMEEAKLK